MGEPARGYSWAPFQPGNRMTMTHGADTADLVAPEAAELEAWLLEVAPWTSMPAFARTRRRWAWVEAQCERIRRWLDEQGPFTEKDELRPAASYLERLEGRADSMAQRLGLDSLSLLRLMATAGTVDTPAALDGLEALRQAGAAVRRAAEQKALPAGEEPS